MTYFPEKSFSYSIFYGCSDVLQQHVVSRLRHAEDALIHPLFIPGIFAEEERERHRKLITSQLERLSNTSLSLASRDFTFKSLAAMSEDGSSETRAVETWQETYELKIGLENFKEQLAKMIAHADELKEKLFAASASTTTAGASGLPEEDKLLMRRSGDKIKERLEDIILDYNAEIRRCDLIMEGMTLTTQMVSL